MVVLVAFMSTGKWGHFSIVNPNCKEAHLSLSKKVKALI